MGRKSVIIQNMYAELVINIEVPLAGTFHYHVPADLRPHIRIGQMVEVEFGRRLAQAIVISVQDDNPFVDIETKPVLHIIQRKRVVQPYQITLARWMSERYICLLYTSPSPRDLSTSRMPSSA